MPKTPVVSGREVVAALLRAGFVVDRQTGSHVVLVHQTKQRTAAVPVHGGRDVPSGTLHRVLKQAGLTLEEFRALLQ